MEERSPKSATKKEVQIVRKLIVMRNLAVYWNELSTLISDLTDQNEIKCLMQTGMAMNGGKCSGYKYDLVHNKLHRDTRVGCTVVTSGKFVVPTEVA
ncbi:unnamed protein product [Toxocara canis]|uniref:Reverse transcriptase domain-containing protein n=1 Tax=Toxocara canis TaxID=6265 RepID=A0A183V3B7_TOXCA|nr:unnamed protein product [Toxocara canis]